MKLKKKKNLWHGRVVKSNAVSEQAEQLGL
jgi:hypothetical protein